MLEKLPKDLTKKVGSLLQLAMICSLCFYVFSKLSTMGWETIFNNLPTHPLFYCLFAINFILLPLSESFIYRRHWLTLFSAPQRFLPALMRKQALNDVVLGYSGEAYLYFWARNNVKQDHKLSASLIKDNTLLSGASSSTLALFFLIGFWLMGDFDDLLNTLPEGVEYVGGVMIFSIMIVILLLLFGRRLLKIKAPEISRITSIHIGRLILFESLQVLQWSLILPEVPLAVWVGFVTTKMMITRIPFTPNKELILLGLAVSLADFVPSPEAAVAGIFLANTLLNQLSNTGVFILMYFSGFRSQKELEATSPKDS
ncbi:hypothetical protein QGN29_14190 [Temperatibacter marinus]|uniref:Uncharacterized protein n=1 Tax=Temperatibacter marinus TaxID=1456591 RepID=A0AA52EI24_9PROT|nr:hypothetical protein [Temperatibacter marinus]WND02699.1 hypothetical protein QGN29_14190 [Temperatibacter marinus]